MRLSRQKFRELVVQFLFAFEEGEQEDPSELIFLLMEEHHLSKKTIQGAYEQAKTIWQERDRFDLCIKATSTDYAFERVPPVERTLLRLALFEFDKEEPSIVISEAIRLAKKFSTPESSRFIHAVLDASLHPSQEATA